MFFFLKKATKKMNRNDDYDAAPPARNDPQRQSPPPTTTNQPPRQNPPSAGVVGNYVASVKSKLCEALNRNARLQPVFETEEEKEEMKELYRAVYKNLIELFERELRASYALHEVTLANFATSMVTSISHGLLYRVPLSREMLERLC